MRRRTLLAGAIVPAGRAARGQPRPPNGVDATLGTAPIEVIGEWHGSAPHSVLTVVTRMRAVSLAGIALLSDRQPGTLRVDGRTSGPPRLRLHFDNEPYAWITLDAGGRAWCQLAYQFGHELGHVLCNSWRQDWKLNPSNWLEEALVEAFSIRGLGRLADSWGSDPPFPGDQAYGNAVRSYRDDLVTKYRAYAAEQNADRDLAAWFQARRGALEAGGGIVGPAREAVSAMLDELNADPRGIEALGAVNRWPDRSGALLEEYLTLWLRSCTALGASKRLPSRLRERLLG